MTSLPAIAPERLAAFACALPKAELHIHIEGSLEPDMLLALAHQNGVALPYADARALRQAYVFDNLQSFLDIYHAGTTVLKTEQDFYDMACAYLARAQSDHVRHAEIFFDTQTHTGHGLSAATVINGLHRACMDAPARFGMTASLILCFLRHLSEDAALACLEEVKPLRHKIVGIGLASSEQGHPPTKFIQAFAQARRQGYRLVAHAGEEAGPAYIWAALTVLRVERIDHGVQAVHDRVLLDHLAKQHIPLTVCPLSNLQLRVVPSLAQHPLRRLLDAGIKATINSDDPAYFGGYINDNFTRSAAALQLSAQHLYTLAHNSFEASFLETSQRAVYLDELQAVAENFR